MTVPTPAPLTFLSLGCCRCQLAHEPLFIWKLSLSWEVLAITFMSKTPSVGDAEITVGLSRMYKGMHKG